MLVRFWGVRGSIPVPGRITNRYGGNTSCVEVRPKGEDPIIIDAGTGIRKLGKALMEESFRDGRGSAAILISHTHWDHVQGLPFFSPLYREGNRIHIFARQRDMHLEAVFSQQHHAPYFPVPLSAIQAEMQFHEVIEGSHFNIGSAKVTCARLNHPWVAIAYRIEVDRAAVVYCTDTAPFTDFLFGQDFIKSPDTSTVPPAVRGQLAAMRASVVALAHNADLLIYDTQFTQEEYKVRPHWGHSRPSDALEIAREANAKQLCLFHHAPLRSDDENDLILAAARAAAGDGVSVVSAYEGLEIPLGDT